MGAAAEKHRFYDSSTLSLWPTSDEEDPDYLARQLLTYLGNKRSILAPIGRAVEQVKKRLGKSKLHVLDAFAGSGVVSRYLKRHASLLVSNDFEDYAAVTARCFLQNRSAVDPRVAGAVRSLNSVVDDANMEIGFFERLYAPHDDANIRPGDRVFYSKMNARRLDNYRRLMARLPASVMDSLMGPLLSEASVHANTSGVFKGFHKNPATGIGQFGGGGVDALKRILGEIRLEEPLLSRFECDVEVMQDDANALPDRVRSLDLVYLDPPYNQHPYGSNYFMLNLLVSYREPTSVSKVSGIPTDWRRSRYNVRADALPSLKRFVGSIDAKFLLISFNDEGFISPEEMRAMLCEVGRVNVIEFPYNTYRGSRNLSGRSIHVMEQLFLVEKT
ncbi:MAG: DNA adenine methylase [Polyangia bacterium]